MTQIVKVRNMMRLIAATSAALMAMSAGQAFASVNVDQENDTTGYGSEQLLDVNHEFNFDFDLENILDANHDVDVEVNTGEIWLEGNTEVDGVETGRFVGEISFDTEANNGAGEVEFPNGGGNVEVDVNNILTGAYSSQETNVNHEQNVDIDVTNEADVNHDVKANINTGRIDASYNTEIGGNGIVTGDATLVIDTKTKVNEGAGSLDLGNLGGDVNVSGTNEKTGYGSSQETNVNSETNVDADITNEADVNHDIDVTLNTGDINAYGNTSLGGVTTGDAAFRLRTQTEANNN